MPRVYLFAIYLHFVHALNQHQITLKYSVDKLFQAE